MGKDKKEEDSDKKVGFVALSVEDFLNKQHNIHLDGLVFSWIILGVLEKLDPNKDMGTRTVPSGTKGMPSTIRQKAKDLLKIQVAKFNEHAEILKAIEQRSKELEEFKQDNDLWQKESRFLIQQEEK